MRVPSWLGFFGVLSVGGCATPPAQQVEPRAQAQAVPVSTAASPAASVETEPAIAVHEPVVATLPPAQVEQLSAGGVTDDDYVRAEFFTWTTAEQLAKLRTHKRLLFKDKSSAGELSFFDRRLEVLAASSYYSAETREVAQLLLRPALRYRRFGWVNPWGTSRGWGPIASYGSVLVKLRLKPNALIARLTSRGWEFRTLSGELVDSAEVLGGKAAQRIGAVFHVWDSAEQEEAAPKLESRPPFREYVFPNESMIERWEVGTPELRARLDQDQELFGAVADLGLKSSEAWLTSVPGEWTTRGTDFDALYAAGLAFAAQVYEPSQAAQILAALKAESRPAALAVDVTTRYGQAPPAALLKAPPPRQWNPAW